MPSIPLHPAIAVLLLSGLMAMPNTYADNPSVIFADNFVTAKGYRTTNANGVESSEGTSQTRLVYLFVSDSVDGKLTLTAVEDDDERGPDGKPGVMAFELTTLPKSASYCGFVFLGRPEKKMQIRQLRVANHRVLDKTRLSFRYKAANPDDANVGADWSFRLEPDLPNSYNSRIDFGVLRANSQWQSFDKPLSEGANLEAFLAKAPKSPEGAVKMVIGQSAGFNGYEPGDRLLIDDIKVTIVR